MAKPVKKIPKKRIIPPSQERREKLKEASEKLWEHLNANKSKIIHLRERINRLPEDVKTDLLFLFNSKTSSRAEIVRRIQDEIKKGNYSYVDEALPELKNFDEKFFEEIESKLRDAEAKVNSEVDVGYALERLGEEAEKIGMTQEEMYKWKERMYGEELVKKLEELIEKYNIQSVEDIRNKVKDPNDLMTLFLNIDAVNFILSKSSQ